MNFYNEIEPYAAQWLSNLSEAGHIPRGVVDGRDIREVGSTDVAGYRQAHFFAGIGGWSHALKLAGWPDDAAVWTGSCPCQPFSSAGRKKGLADQRHLWPDWFRLIQQCRPPVIFGEQVASPDGLGWLDIVSTDLENENYAFGAADLCAAGVGAPHIRQRLYFVALAREQRRQGLGLHLQPRRPLSARAQAVGSRAPGGLGDSGRTRPSLRPVSPDEHPALRIQGDAVGAAGFVRGAWEPADFIWCSDGKYRPIEPGLVPLADGIPQRVGGLKAYGNAIVPQVAAEFIQAVMS